jgi:NADH:ubiquinone oxidoreductase subunit B-like Fe-S oxidoreductase
MRDVEGIFDNYATIQGVDHAVPVGVFVPGCPPNPDTLMFGIFKLREMIPQGVLPKTSSYSTNAGDRRFVGVADLRLQ